VGDERWDFPAGLDKFPVVDPPAGYNTWAYKEGSGEWADPPCGGPKDCLVAYHNECLDDLCNDYSAAFCVYGWCLYWKWGCS